MPSDIEKIKLEIANKDLNFTFLERQYISSNQELAKGVIAVLEENNSLLTNDLIYVLNNYVESISNDLLLKMLILDLDGSSLYNYLYEYKSDTENFPNEWLAKHYKEYLSEKIEEKITAIQHGDIISKFELDFFIEEKKYEKICLVQLNKYDKDKKISSENEKILQENYPFASLGFPWALKSIALDFLDKMPYMSLDVLGYLITELSPDSNDYALAVNYFFKKIVNPEEVRKIIDFSSVKRAFFRIPNIDNYNEYLIEHHIYFNLDDYIENILDKDSIYTRTYNDIKSNDISFLTLKSSIIYGNGKIDDERIIETFLDNGDIEVIIHTNPSLKDKYQQKIIEKIENGNEKLKAKLDDMETLGLYPILLNYALQNNLVKKIVFSFNLEDEELTNLVINTIKNNKDINIPHFYLSGRAMNKNVINILEAMIDSGNILKIAGGLNEIFQAIAFNQINLQHLKEKMIREIKKSDEIADWFLRNVMWKAYLGNNTKNKSIEEILYAVMGKNYFTANKLLDYINHNENLSYLYNMETFNTLRPYLIEKLNGENLDYLVKMVGPKLLRYIDNDSIKELLKLPREDVDKILKLFSDQTYTIRDLEANYDAIKQYEYSKNNNAVINIFSDILHTMDAGGDITKYLEALNSVMDSKFYQEFQKKYDVTNYQKPMDLLNLIINKIKLEPEKRDKYLEVLHEITNYYIRVKREEYRSTYNCYQDLKVPYEIDEDSKYKCLVDFLVRNIGLNKEKEGIYKIVNEEIVKNPNIDVLLYEETLDYLAGKLDNLTYDEVTIKRNIKNVKNLIKAMLKDDTFYYNNLDFFNSFTDLMVKQGKIKVKYYLNDNSIRMDDFSRIDALSKLRIDILKDKLLNDDVIYQELLDIIVKKKILNLPNNLIECINANTDINYQRDYFISFINYFYKIRELDKKRMSASKQEEQMSLINILKNAQSYGGCSDVYKMILGSEDARLIDANPGPNSASRKTRDNERLKEALLWTKKNYQRQVITVPPINTIVSLNDKKMQCIVGNFTNPCNLTHGERTGACMRIGGVGESLFNFALENENGFHIRFVNPDTNSYVSRVTGFRNGNTVFLNELRCSCDSAYTDDDIVNFCTQVSKMLIENSKDSTMPIDNVVIHRAYATQNMKKTVTYLKVDNIKKGLPYFYSDVGSQAIVLATSSDEEFVPINFDKTKVPKYPVTRDKLIYSDKLGDLQDIIQRVHAVKIYLETDDLTNIEPIIFDNFMYGVGNNDWYIYIDNYFNIHSEIINIDNRALKEYEVAMEYIKNYINEQIKKEGVNHGI